MKENEPKGFFKDVLLFRSNNKFHRWLGIWTWLNILHIIVRFIIFINKIV
jgi:hypothetical protein